nr:reverse transcriptase domain-containing protein [Tanacetum cinerariifolium]
MNLLQLVQANPYHGFERPPTSRRKSLDLLKDLRRHLERLGNDLKKCLEHVPTTDLQRENASKTDDRIDKLADQISTLVDIFSKKVVTPATVKAVEESCVTYGGNHAYYNCVASNYNQLSVCAATGTYNQVAPQDRASNHMVPPGFSLVQNSQNSGVAYKGPSIPSPKKVVERETEETTGKEQTNFQGSTAQIQPPIVPILEPDVSKTLPKPNIPYPLRLNDQKLHEKSTNQMEKFFQIFQDLHFDISFMDAMMSSPDHLTSNLEDAFSLNFPNYLPLASSDYVPASPGKTYSSSSNSFRIIPLASPTLSLFHDDPYIKVLQAFYTENSPITPPIITPPSSMPNPQEFFLPEDLLSPKKQGHDQSSSSTSSLP